MSDLLYEVKDKVATITLNRPDKLNAFTGDMITGWAKSLAEAQADDSVNVVIVTGAGRAFCSGGDVGRMRSGEPTAMDGKNSLWAGGRPSSAKAAREEGKAGHRHGQRSGGRRRHGHVRDVRHSRGRRERAIL